MSQQRFHTIALAVTALLCQHVMAARPVDNGTPGYAKRVYVDNTAASCTAVATCGTQAKPFSDLASAIKVVTPGTELIIAGGSPYYGTPTGALPTDITRGVISFEQLKSSETQASTLVRKWTGTANPVIRGSLKVTGWTRVDTLFNGLPSYTYSHRWTLTNQQAFASNPTKVVEPQQVFNGTTSLLQVGGTPFDYKYPAPAGTEYSQQEAVVGGPLWPGYIAPDSVNPQLKLKPNEFYFDTANTTLYVRLKAAIPSTGLEVSAYQHILYGAEYPRNVYNLTLQDIDFERSNTSAYSRGAAVSLLGKNITLDRIKVAQADLACLGITAVNFVVKGSTFEYCGQTGIGAAGQKGLITENIVRKNNQRHFNRDWEAGGMKLIGGGTFLYDKQRENGSEPNPLPLISSLDNSTISRNRVYDNNGVDRAAVGRPAVSNNAGHGIWLDTDNNDNVIANNVVAYNGIGLFLEINARNKITGNQVFGNVAQGIQFKESDSTLSGNWVIGNAGFGLVIPVDTRKINPNDASYQPYRNTITNNRLAWDSNAQNPLEIAVIVDPANPVTNKQTVSGNRYCTTTPSFSLGKLSGGIVVYASSDGQAYTLDRWNQQLAAFGTGPDTSAVTTFAIPSDLKTSIANKSETLVNNAYSGNVLSSSYAASCGF